MGERERGREGGEGGREGGEGGEREGGGERGREREGEREGGRGGRGALAYKLEFGLKAHRGLLDSTRRWTGIETSRLSRTGPGQRSMSCIHLQCRRTNIGSRGCHPSSLEYTPYAVPIRRETQR